MSRFKSQKKKIIFVATIILNILYCLSAWAQPSFTVSDWMKLDAPTKLKLMTGFIAEAKKDNVIIRLPAEYYVKEVDSIIDNSIRNRDDQPSTPIGVIIHSIAAMDGDWDNGENKLEHAQKWLGPSFDEFRKSFPEKYKRLMMAKTNNTRTWKLLGYTDDEIIYYDQASIDYGSNDIVKIWIKREYKDREAVLKDFKVRGLYRSEYKNYSHTLNLYKINCAKNQFMIMASYMYDKDNVLLDAFDHPNQPDRVVDIKSNSVISGVSKPVCDELKNGIENK